MESREGLFEKNRGLPPISLRALVFARAERRHDARTVSGWVAHVRPTVATAGGCLPQPLSEPVSRQAIIALLTVE